MFVLAFSLYKFPLQHHITLARFQHYGICLYVWALGFVLQVIWSWKRLSARGRACQISTALYVGTFALIFYENPWLDSRMSVQTMEQDFLRLAYAILCALFGLVVSVIWVFWLLEQKPNEMEN